MSKLALTLQLTAAFLMGADLFFGKSQLESINSSIQRFAGKVQARVDKDLKSSMAEATQQWAKILVSVSFVGLSMLITYGLPSLVGQLPPWIIGGLGLVAIFLLGAVPRLASLVTTIAVPLALASFFRAITGFLIRCPKGTIFGVGFLFLLASFVPRFLEAS